MQKAPNQVEYANWWSKALFGKAYENQFVIPLPPAKPISGLLKLIERVFFNIDLNEIQIEKPVFIVGLPRSGTSLLYNLLCAHERAAYVTNSINSFTDAICAIEWARKALNLNIRGERFLQDSIDADFSSPSEPAMFWGKWIGRNAESLFWEEKTLKDFTPEKIAEIHGDVKRMLYTFGVKTNGRFICKYPVFQTELKMIQALFPDARFIHIIRDGRPTANSLIKLYHLCNSQIQKIQHPDLKYLVPYPRVKNLEKYIKDYGPADIRCTSHIWQDSIEAVEAVQGELHHLIQIRYEDLLTNPRAELERLFEFIELPWPTEQNSIFKREFDGIGVLRHTNQYGQYDVVEQIAGRTLKKLGYLS